jgi:hypothetical protein
MQGEHVEGLKAAPDLVRRGKSSNSLKRSSWNSSWSTTGESAVWRSCARPRESNRARILWGLGSVLPTAPVLPSEHVKRTERYFLWIRKVGAHIGSRPHAKRCKVFSNILGGVHPSASPAGYAAWGQSPYTHSLRRGSDPRPSQEATEKGAPDR